MNPPDGADGAEPLTVLHRLPGMVSWRTVGTAAGYREALDLVTGKGDWWFKRPEPPTATAAASLFNLSPDDAGRGE